MKMQILKFSLCFVLFLFMSCEKNNDESTQKNYVLSNDSKYVKIKVPKTFNDYNVKNSNDKVAFVFQPDSSADYFYIAAKNIGNTNIVVSDKSDDGNAISISIRVNEYIFVKSPLFDLVYVKRGFSKLLKLEKTDLEIPMVSNSDPNIAKLSDFNSMERTVWVEGLSVGTSLICLNDLCWGESGFRVNVVDDYPIHAYWRKVDDVNTTNGNVSIISKISRLDVLCGNANYEVLISDPSVLKCEVEEYSGEIELPLIENPATLRIIPLKADANTTLTIQDSKGQTLVFKIATPWNI